MVLLLLIAAVVMALFSIGKIPARERWTAMSVLALAGAVWLRYLGY